MRHSDWVMAAIAALALTVAERGERSMQDDPQDLFPPSFAEADETPTLDLARFDLCEETMTRIVSGVGSKVLNRRYTVSRRWGYVLRADIEVSPNADSGPIFVCWTKTGEDVMVKYDGFNTWRRGD